MWKQYIDNYYASDYGEIKNIKTDRILKQQISNKGYAKTNIIINGKIKTIFIHKVVAELFIPNPLNLPYINHKDGNKLNNFASNIEWCTPSQNTRHALDHGLINPLKGSECYQAKLTEQDIIAIRNKYKEGFTFNELAKIYNVTRRNIYLIVHYITWKHVK